MVGEEALIQSETGSWVIHRLHRLQSWTGTRGRTASQFPCPPRGENDRLSTGFQSVESVICGSNRLFLRFIQTRDHPPLPKDERVIRSVR